MKITSLSNIFIICPANSSTGGPEALHQLSHKLRTVLKYNVKMFYIDKNSHEPPKPDVYNIYETEETNNIIDEETNILIIPESLTNYIFKYQKSQKIVWWLSVDFYSVCMKNRHRGLKFYFSKYIKGKKEEKEYHFEDLPDVYHWAQSYRSFLYLLNNGVSEEKITKVCDYMNPLFLEKAKQNIDIREKEDIIIYNPKKGKKEIEFIKKKCSKYQWIPIHGMTPLQVADLMKRAKLYIDFGYNPGRDRMLRESILMQCVIISGIGGSSEYQQDLNIPKEYKFEYSKDIIPKIVTKIEEVVKNYETCILDFNEYRKETLEEENNFEKQLKYFS